MAYYDDLEIKAATPVRPLSAVVGDRNKWLRDAIASARPDPTGRPDNVPHFDETPPGPAKLLDVYDTGYDDTDIEAMVLTLRRQDEPGEDMAYYLELSPVYKPAPEGGGAARREGDLLP